MIPKSEIIAWSKKAPWNNNYMVEQDLIIERALIEIYSSPNLCELLAFRGGTALHKLYFEPQPRYSEDIDLVQRNPGTIGDILTLLRERLAFLGNASYERVTHGNKLIYRFSTEYEPVVKLRLKIEINTREHFNIFDYQEIEREYIGEWFSGKVKIVTFTVEELLGTKLRALYQRSKGRDLFDIWYATEKMQLDIKKLLHSFHKYLENENISISKKDFISNLEEKIINSEFTGDIVGLLRPGIKYDTQEAWKSVKSILIDKI
ncbi:MAG: nucleotidyl transferase AbiEii/AbiGii toxin family protein [Ignavibacteria bacterium]|nr:nucleotidyl transferase AbiEii/AbiGii toxin family protein [Ignavibacteria bacterium]